MFIYSYILTYHIRIRRCFTYPIRALLMFGVYRNLLYDIAPRDISE